MLCWSFHPWDQLPMLFVGASLAESLTQQHVALLHLSSEAVVLADGATAATG